MSSVIPDLNLTITDAFAGVLLTLYRLGSQYNNSMVEVGAILSIFIGLIGLIILYMGLDDLAK